VFFSKWWAVKVSISNSAKNRAKNRGETGIFAEGDVEIKRAWDSRTYGKVIVLLNPRHVTSLFAWNDVRWELKIHVSYSSCADWLPVTQTPRLHGVDVFSRQVIFFTILSLITRTHDNLTFFDFPWKFKLLGVNCSPSSVQWCTEYHQQARRRLDFPLTILIGRPCSVEEAGEEAYDSPSFLLHASMLLIHHHLCQLAGWSLTEEWQLLCHPTLALKVC